MTSIPMHISPVFFLKARLAFSYLFLVKLWQIQDIGPIQAKKTDMVVVQQEKK